MVRSSLLQINVILNGSTYMENIWQFKVYFIKISHFNHLNEDRLRNFSTPAISERLLNYSTHLKDSKQVNVELRKMSLKTLSRLTNGIHSSFLNLTFCVWLKLNQRHTEMVNWFC